MDLVNIFGKMALLIQATSKKVLSMDKENGKKVKTKRRIFTKANTATIKKMVMAYSSGRAATYIVGNIQMMKEKALERCDGQMEVYISGNGIEAFSMDMAK